MRLFKTEADQDSFEESLFAAMDRVFGDKLNPKQQAEWLVAHGDDMRSEIESFLAEAVRRVEKPKAMPAGPVLDFGRIQLWAYDAGQPCPVAEHRSFHFGGDNTAGLVYVDKGNGGFNATDYPINNESTWKWIHEWMSKGFKAEGYLGGDGKLKA